MKDLFICTKEIIIEIKDIEKIGANLALKLSLLSQKIKYIFSKIELCPSIESANKYFDLLDQIQIVLASLVFKYEIGLPDNLFKFLIDFDNFEETKNYYFKSIKSGKYKF
jgi:hypothetical protein